MLQHDLSHRNTSPRASPHRLATRRIAPHRTASRRFATQRPTPPLRGGLRREQYLVGQPPEPHREGDDPPYVSWVGSRRLRGLRNGDLRFWRRLPVWAVYRIGPLEVVTRLPSLPRPARISDVDTLP